MPDRKFSVDFFTQDLILSENLGVFKIELRLRLFTPVHFLLPSPHLNTSPSFLTVSKFYFVISVAVEQHLAHDTVVANLHKNYSSFICFPRGMIFGFQRHDLSKPSVLGHSGISV